MRSEETKVALHDPAPAHLIHHEDFRERKVLTFFSLHLCELPKVGLNFKFFQPFRFHRQTGFFLFSLLLYRIILWSTRQSQPIMMLAYSINKPGDTKGEVVQVPKPVPEGLGFALIRVLVSACILGIYDTCRLAENMRQYGTDVFIIE